VTSWQGLETENLDQGQDLAITTDFRTVLSEIVVRQLGNIKLGAVFPSITPEIYSSATKLNIVNAQTERKELFFAGASPLQATRKGISQRACSHPNHPMADQRRGSTIVNVLPEPGALRTVTWPP
jgi:hypothetical protein